MIPHDLRLSTVIQLPDGRVGTICQKWLTGVGGVWGKHTFIMPDTGFGPDLPLPDFMLRETSLKGYFTNGWETNPAPGGLMSITLDELTIIEKVAADKYVDEYSISDYNPMATRLCKEIRILIKLLECAGEVAEQIGDSAHIRFINDECDWSDKTGLEIRDAIDAMLQKELGQ